MIGDRAIPVVVRLLVVSKRWSRCSSGVVSIGCGRESCEMRDGVVEAWVRTRSVQCKGVMRIGIRRNSLVREGPVVWVRWRL